METFKLQKRAEVLLTTELQAQITLLHNQCPTNKEWSGLLVYKVTKGSVEEFLDNDEAELELTCENVFLMDFGDATFTSFEGNESWIKFFELFPQIDPTRQDKDNGYYIGKLHSHHNMRAFHSGIDTQDLVDNAPTSPMFLSVVCNYDCQPFSEISIEYEKEIEGVETWSIPKWLKKQITKHQKKEKRKGVIIVPCDTVYEGEEWLINQIEEVELKNRKTTVYVPNRIGFDHKSSTNSSVNKVYKPEGVDQNIYRKVLNEIPELLLLGHDPKNIAPKDALNKANTLVTTAALPTYEKAFMQYFKSYWFDAYFFNTNIKEAEAIDAVKEFVKLHDDNWLANKIETVCDTYKKEHC